MRQTKEQFEADYIATHPDARFGVTHVAMECTCDDGGGPTHWAAVRNNEEAIRSHLEDERLLNDLKLWNDNGRNQQTTTPDSQ